MDLFRQIAIDSMVILLGLIYAWLIVVYAFPLAARLGVVDHPKSQLHKAHALPTPLVGGIATLPPALLAMSFGLGFEKLSADTNRAMLAMAFAVAMSMIVGFFDDRKHIPAMIRLVICGTVFAVPLVLHGEFVIQYVSLESFHFKYDFGGLAIAFSIICLLAFQNAVNMADGRNGLVAGLSIIWCLTLLAQGAHPSNLALGCLLAGLIVTYIANCAGRLFLGDAGTYGLSAMIGLTAVWIHRSYVGLLTTQVVAMFAIPILDMCRLIVLRVARGQSPFVADHSHLHHYLDQAFGWNIGRKIYFTLVIVPIVIANFGDDRPVLGVIVAVVGYALTIAVSCLFSTRKMRTS